MTNLPANMKDFNSNGIFTEIEFVWQGIQQRISKDENGLFNLTEVFKASGLHDSKKPSAWARYDKAKVFIERQNNQRGKSHLAYEVRKGGSNPGTWGNERILTKYLQWLSPEFEDVVLDAVEAIGSGKVRSLISEPSSDDLLLVAKDYIKLHGKLKEVEAQRDKAIKEKGEVGAGREGTLFSRLGRLACFEEVLSIVRKSCDFVDENEYIIPDEVGRNVRSFLKIKKLPLSINSLLCEMGLQEFENKVVEKKLKGRSVKFNIRYTLTKKGEKYGAYLHTGIITRNTKITTSINWDHKVIGLVIDFLKEASFR